MSEKFLTPIGRLVGGHPKVRRGVEKDGKPVMQADGVTPATEAYFGLAIPKTAGLDWKQEPWGQAIVRAAAIGWTGGQPNLPGFAWKITDGDSTIPNQAGNIPNQREGYPGHWVLNLSTRLMIKCFHVGNYCEMTGQIADPNEIKPGDYGRVFLEAKANFPAQSPGVYLNPSMFELSRAGELIILDSGPSASEVFGGGATTTATTTAANVAPANDFLNPGGGPTPPGAGPTPPATEPNRLVEGKVYTAEQLRGFKWTPAQIEAAPVAP